jgi:hypothetical protein
VGTSEASAQFKVETSDGLIHDGSVTSSTPVVINIGNNYQVTDDRFDNRGKGLRVYSTGADSIYVLANNFVTFINFGTYLAYPCLMFENNSPYEYVILSVKSSVGLSQFLLVGCAGDTKINIVPTQNISIPQDPQSSQSTATTVESGSMSPQFTMHKLQTLLVSSTRDLTGTKIISNKPLTVISGHECANVPSTASGCEPLAVQMPPTFTWGTEFFLTPFVGRRGLQAFKAVTSQNDTLFSLSCGTTSNETREDIAFQITTDQNCYLETSEPVLVTQLSFGGSLDRMGDPAIALVSPIDQYIHEIDFISFPTRVFSGNFISITVSAEHYNPDKILLDGTKVNCEWQEIYNDAVRRSVVGYGCNTTVSSGFTSHTRHIVTHSDQDGLISVLAYGFSRFPAQGYAYLSGQELKVSISGT